MRRLECALVCAVLLSCEPVDGPLEEFVSSSEGSTTASCPEVPECNYCPDDPTLLCNQPCVTGDPPCGNEQGDRMTCTNGAWICEDEPYRDGQCTDLCAAAPSCSEAGCNDGIELQLFSGGSFEPGAYELVIDRDGAESTCTFVISDDIGCEIPPCVPDTTCNALYDLSNDLPQITMALPISTALSVSVARDGDLLVEVTPTIEYELVVPNGPGCTPTCGLATVTVDVP